MRDDGLAIRSLSQTFMVAAANPNVVYLADGLNGDVRLV